MFHRIILAGHLGVDPLLRYTVQGQAVTSFSVATNRYWTDAHGQQHEETVWIRVSTWGRLAEICNQYLRKGRPVLCEGRLTVDPETGGPRLWKGADGIWRASYEMTATEVRFLGRRDGADEAEVDALAEAFPPDLGDDLSFGSG